MAGRAPRLAANNQLRPLAVTTAKRSAALPDLPTIAAAGVPGYDISTWYGLWAPKGTPREITERIALETAKILKLPDVRERYAALGAEAVGSTPEEFAAYCRSELIQVGEDRQGVRCAGGLGDLKSRIASDQLNSAVLADDAFSR